MDNLNVAMHKTRWKYIHFTNITNETYKYIGAPLDYSYVFVDVDYLYELLDDYNEYDKDAVIDQYCKPNLIYGNTKPVLALIKSEEQEIEYNLSKMKTALVVDTFSKDRELIKKFYENVSLLTGENIVVNSSIHFGQQGDFKKLIGRINSLTECNDFIDNDVSNVKNDLNEWIQEMKVPMRLKYLESARYNYLLAYRQAFSGMEFVILMTAMETLLVKRSEPIKRTLCNRGSKLYINKKSIKQEIKRLYELRCDIVHEGNFRKPSSDDVILLRRILRKLILIMYMANKEKGDFLNLLNDDSSNKSIQEIVKRVEKLG